MPTYTYKCPFHGEFEVEQKITDEKLRMCGQEFELSADAQRILRMPPRVTCQAPVERLISGGTSFLLRGSGWAKDGYR